MIHRAAIKRQNLGSLSGGDRWQWSVKCQSSGCPYSDYARRWGMAIIMANYHATFTRD